MAKKGDVLIWHGDLMHGGAPIQDFTRTRLSLIAHLMPLGVMPTFFDFSQAGVIPYAGGGYSIDTHWSDTLTSRRATTSNGSAGHGGPQHLLDLWRGAVPLSVRKRVPPSFVAWTHKHVLN
jgi:hypothetical protein